MRRSTAALLGGCLAAACAPSPSSVPAPVAAASQTASAAPAPPAPERLAEVTWNGGQVDYILAVNGPQIFLATSYNLWAFDPAAGGLAARAAVDVYAPAATAFAGDAGVYWTAGYTPLGEAPGGAVFFFDPRAQRLETLARLQRLPCAMRVDGDVVTWVDLDAGEVRTVRRGEAPRAVGRALPGQPFGGGCNARLAGDAGALYLPTEHVPAGTHDDAIAVLPRAGGPARLLALGVSSPHAVTVDGDHVYFGEGVQGEDRLVRVSREGGPVETFVPGTAITTDLVAHGDHFYWVEGRYQHPYAIKRVRRRGGEPEVLYQGDARQVHELAVTEAHLIWVTHGTPPGDCAQTSFHGEPAQRRCKSADVMVLRLPRPR